MKYQLKSVFSLPFLLSGCLFISSLLIFPCDTLAKTTEKRANWIIEQGVGKVYLPVSTKQPEAKKSFDLGLAMLESFEFPEAVRQFQRAQQYDPSFAMAYWGEAMAQLRILWEWLDYEKAEAIYQKMAQHADLKNVNAMERALIEATRALLTQGDRDLPGYDEKSNLMAHRHAMTTVSQQFPNNPDVATLYAQAVLGTRYGTHDYQNNNRAGLPLLKLYQRYPNHPGLTHFILHSFENARQTYHAKDAAERYIQIAPGAIHALHMPSHHYYYQGDWVNLAKTNEFAWQQSLEKQQAMGLSDDYLEYHGNLWRIYAYLQLQQPERALAIIRETLTKQETRSRNHYLVAGIAHFLLHTADQPQWRVLHHEAQGIKVNLDLLPAYDRAGYLFARAVTADHTRRQKIDHAIAEFKQEILPTLAQQPFNTQEQVTIVYKQLEAMAEIEQGHVSDAITTLIAQAKAEDEAYREHGVQLIIVKPAHELLADVYLKQKFHGEAFDHYQLELMNNPGRLLSKRGIKVASKWVGRPEKICKQDLE